MKLAELARQLQCTLEGDPEIEITAVAAIADAGPGQLTFLANRRYHRFLATTRASAVLISPGEKGTPMACLRSENPQLDFARALGIFHQPPRYTPSIHPSALISPSAQLAPDAHIGPYCFVGERVRIGERAVLHSFVSIYSGVSIGDDFLAHSHVVIREECRIGNRVTLQSGVVIGGDGFGFAPLPTGAWLKIPQTGIVALDDDVEIQANSVVDRATIGETHIGRGTKIDDLVLVGHAAKIGEDTLLCGQVGIAGTTSVGNRCILGGQVGASGHLHISDGVMITPQSGLSNDLGPAGTYSGSPVMPHRDWLRASKVLPHLGELQRTVRRLEREIEELRAAGQN
jgi:UDP-3-O-[3-hydroxymyristoyl] glucosamine N-acyltransferase